MYPPMAGVATGQGTEPLAAKRHMMKLACLKFTLDDGDSPPERRKPFDVLAEGLVLEK